jgi:uncharacterized protein
LLGKLSEWAVTHPAQTIAAVVSLVAIVGIVGALRLTPDAGTDKLVDDGSETFAGTEVFRDRFGDEAIVVLARKDLRSLVLTEDLGQLLLLESCLSGNLAETAAASAEGQDPPPAVCSEIAELGATRVVFGPATFLNQAAAGAQDNISAQYGRVTEQAQEAAAEAAREARRDGADAQGQQAAAYAASQQVLERAVSRFGELASQLRTIGQPQLDNSEFVSAIVFDSRRPSGTPKARFGYLFPSADGALISIRLEPGLDDETRREAIALIRETVADPYFAIDDASYEVSGVPVVIDGLAEELGDELVILLAVAVAVMALTLVAVFGPPLRLLPLLVALGAAAAAFGLLSLVGGSLTMASVAVLPVVIGLGVDYAIQLQARFREAAARGSRPPAAAVLAAVRGGPVIATAAIATAIGFASLVLSPIPMVREFAFALVIGILAALAISLTAGLAALSIAAPARPPKALPGRLGAGTTRARARLAGLTGRGRQQLGRLGRAALAGSIAMPGRVLVVALLLAVTGWVAGTRTEVVSDIRELVPADLPALQGVDELQEVTGVSGELDVLVRGESVTSPEAIAWMRDFQGPPFSDLFQPGAAPPERRVEAVLDVVPDYLLQAILSRPEGEEEVANIAFLIPVMPLDEQEALIDSIRSELDPPPGLSAEVVGLPALAADANAQLAGSRYWLTLVSLLAVGAVLLAIMRDVRRALTPLIPIALATGWSALVLASLEVELNPMSATLGVLVIAVATEFSVILAARYDEERAAGRSIGEALRLTYSRTGAAVLASGITSIAGFGVLVFSGITMLRDFGLATVVDLSVSLLGVLLVLPAALVWSEAGFRPFPAWRASLRRRLRRRAAPADAG